MPPKIRTRHQQIVYERNLAKDRAVRNKLERAAAPHIERIFQKAEQDHRERLDAHLLRITPTPKL